MSVVQLRDTRFDLTQFNFTGLKGNQATVLVDSPEGPCRVAVKHTTERWPFQAEALELFGQTPPAKSVARFFPGEFALRQWLFSLERGKDGPLAPIPRP